MTPSLYFLTHEDVYGVDQSDIVLAPNPERALQLYAEANGLQATEYDLDTEDRDLNGGGEIAVFSIQPAAVPEGALGKHEGNTGGVLELCLVGRPI